MANISVDTKVGAEGGEEVLWALEDVPLQPEGCGEARGAASGGPHARAEGCFLKDTVAVEGTCADFSAD